MSGMSLALAFLLASGAPDPCACTHAQALLPDLRDGWRSDREPGGGVPSDFCKMFQVAEAHEVCLKEFDPARTDAVFSDGTVEVTVGRAVLDTPYMPGELSPADEEKLKQARIAFTVEIRFVSPDAAFDPAKFGFFCEAVACTSESVIAVRPLNLNSGAYRMQWPLEYRPGEHVLSVILDADPAKIEGATLHLSDALGVKVPDLHFHRAAYDYMEVEI